MRSTEPSPNGFRSRISFLIKKILFFASELDAVDEAAMFALRNKRNYGKKWQDYVPQQLTSDCSKRQTVSASASVFAISSCQALHSANSEQRIRRRTTKREKVGAVDEWLCFKPFRVHDARVSFIRSTVAVDESFKCRYGLIGIIKMCAPQLHTPNHPMVLTPCRTLDLICDNKKGTTFWLRC